MKSYPGLVSAGVFSTGVVLITLAGCGSESQPTTVAPETVATTPAASTAGTTTTSVAENGETKVADDEHLHKPGAHGGIIIPIGSDSYHAEAVIESGGSFRLLMLGKDETRIQEVDVQPVKAFIKVIGDPNATPIELVAVPQDGDSPDKTSQFVGQLPEAFRGRQLDVTIPNLRIAGERFRVGFTTVTQSHAEEMPESLPSDEERSLYLTAGGKYTEADIQANGGVTASKKFKGLVSSHNMFPKPGDRICPITETKANADFTWIVDGKSYQFCCPPCVDEFVKLAKEHPDQLKAPDSYVKPVSDAKDSGSKEIDR
ncbi:MAG: hypothetical protein H7Z17_12040 [Fuerstia sp.]|nr:hypothetical protein [Fuerstiella sp.]